MQLEENTIFANRYKLKRLLGRGGFSEVWLAEDSLTTLNVALKVYAPGAGMDENGVKLFSSEFSLVFNLNHSNLLKPTYYDTFERMPYLVMPYCELGSAAGLIGKITEDEVWSFLRDIASGLEYLHGQEPPVIHQDIKPDNILIDSSGRFLLTDFGISIKARNTLRKSIMKVEGSVGTLAYMGPERFSKFPLPIKASDIFSLGVTLFELLTGTVPFGEHGGLLLQHGAEIPVIEGEWSDELKNIIEICLHKDTWERPTAGEIRMYVQQYLNGEKPALPTNCMKAKEQEEQTNVPDVAPVSTSLSNSVKPAPVSGTISLSEDKDELVTSANEEPVAPVNEDKTEFFPEPGMTSGKKITARSEDGPKISKKFLKWGIPIIVVICLIVLIMGIHRKKQKEAAETRAQEIETFYNEYLGYIHRGDSLADLGNQSQGNDYETFYLKAIEQYEMAGRMEEQYQAEFRDVKDALSKKEAVVKKIDETFTLLVTTAEEAELNQDYEMAEIFYKRAVGLKKSNLLDAFYQRRQAGKESDVENSK